MGIIKAIPKASAKSEVPKNAAFVISRIKPNILDKNVKNDSFIPEETSERFILPAYRYCLFMAIPVK